MMNAWKPALSLLGLLCLAAPQARSQIDCSHTVIGTGAVATAAGTHRVLATLGQSAVGYVRTSSADAALGFWHEVTAAEAVAGTADRETTGPTVLELSASPNPFGGATHISLHGAQGEPVSLVLYDLLGQPVRSLIDTEHADESYAIELFADDLPSGSYTLAVTAGEEQRLLTLLLVR